MRNGSVTSRGTFGCQALLLSLMVGLVLIAVPSAAPLPAGNVGIAARYPLDSGIASDPAVIFADDFESYGSAANLTSKWSQAYHAANLRIATESANVFAGGKSVELTVPRTSSEVSNTLLKSISPERDALFLRYYAKFDAGFNVVGSSHNGSTISGPLLLSRSPRRRVQQVSRQLRSLARQRGHGQSRQAQRVHLPSRISATSGATISFRPASCCRSRVCPFNYGPEFVSRPDVTPVLGRWYSYELMVKANTPGTARRPRGVLAGRRADRRLSESAAAGDDRAQDRSLHDRSARLQQQRGSRAEVVRQRRRGDFVHRPHGHQNPAAIANRVPDCAVVHPTAG